MTVARKSIGERLAQLEAQRKTLQIRLGKQERAIDTRRKVLIGGLAAWLRSELPKFLTRDGDRDLFDDLLEPRPHDPSISNIGNGSAAS
jgi:hypothetical protein